MIFDGHAHVILPTEHHLALMDAAGVERTLLCSTRVHPEGAHDLSSLNQELSVFDAILAGRANDQTSMQRATLELVQVIDHFPQRFIGFGSVPLGLTQAEMATWFQDYVLAHDFRGVGEFTLQPGHVQQLDPVFVLATEHENLPVWVHTLAPMTLEDIRTLIALSRRYPKVPLLLGHMGGMYWRDAIALAKETPQTYIDLSGTITFLGPVIAIQELPERTLFSSDAPYGNPLVARTIVEQATHDEVVRERVLGNNLAELLHLT